MDDLTPDAQTPAPDAASVGGTSAESSAPSPVDAAAPDTSHPAQAEEQETKKKTSPWVWVGVVAAILIVAAIAIASTSSDSGGLLLLFGGNKVTVPSVVGETQADAETMITDAGLAVGQVSEEATLGVAPGVVIAQSPEAETKVKKETVVDITVSMIPEATVPDVTGMNQTDASYALAEQGLRIGAVEYAYSSSAAAGTITAQAPEPDTQVNVGSTVNITVSKGQQQGQVPNVVGLSESDAKSTLKAAGFAVVTTKASSTSVPAGDVISQSPAAGTVMAAGATVTIEVSSGAPSAPRVSVPDLVGLRFIEAFNELQGAGLKINVEFTTSTEYVLTVAEQSPSAGTSVDPGTVVTVTIGLPEFSLESTPTPGGSTDSTTTS